METASNEFNATVLQMQEHYDKVYQEALDAHRAALLRLWPTIAEGAGVDPKDMSGYAVVTNFKEFGHVYLQSRPQEASPQSVIAESLRSSGVMQ